MPDFNPTDLAERVREGLVQQLWRQWRAVGGAVTGAGQAYAMVDPEALLLTSLYLVDRERRLADVAASWVIKNSLLLSIQRLGNMRRLYPTTVNMRLADLAREVNATGKDPRWKSLAASKAEPLGIRAGKPRALAPRFGTWATLMLQLRRGIGVGAKADVLAFVLGVNAVAESRVNVRMILSAVGYTAASVRRVADNLADARFIIALDSAEGERFSQRIYSANADGWATLLRLSKHHAGWPYWQERYLFLIAVLSWLDVKPSAGATDYAMDVGARKLLEQFAAALQRDRALDMIEFAHGAPDRNLLSRTVDNVMNWIVNNG